MSQEKTLQIPVTQWHAPPSYLNVGQQLLLPPPNVLQFLPLLRSQVTGNYRKGEECHERAFISPKIKIQRPLKDKATTAEIKSKRSRDHREGLRKEHRPRRAGAAWAEEAGGKGQGPEPGPGAPTPYSRGFRPRYSPRVQLHHGMTCTAPSGGQGRPGQSRKAVCHPWRGGEGRACARTEKKSRRIYPKLRTVLNCGDRVLGTFLCFIPST